MPKYMVIHRNRVIGVYDSFMDAIEVVAETGGGEVYRVELIARLSEEEVHGLKDALLTTRIEPVEAPITPSKRRFRECILVFDRGFSVEVVSRVSEKYPGVKTYLLTSEVLEGVSGIHVERVEGDLDVMHYVSELVSQGYRVVFITSSKKLYTLLSKVEGVTPIYRSLMGVEKPDDLVSSIISYLDEITCLKSG